MADHKDPTSPLSIIIECLRFALPICGAVVGGYARRSDLYHDSTLLVFFLAIFSGIAGGLIADIIVLSPLTVLITRLANKSPVVNTENKLTKGVEKDTVYRKQCRATWVKYILISAIMPAAFEITRQTVYSAMTKFRVDRDTYEYVAITATIIQKCLQISSSLFGAAGVLLSNESISKTAKILCLAVFITLFFVATYLLLQSIGILLHS
jgi:hypothetical protein